MTNKTRYSGLQMMLHWGIALLVAVNWLTGEAMIEAFDGMIEGEIGKDSLSSGLHLYLGLAILVLAVVRLVVRLVQGKPASQDHGAMAKTAEAAHWGLYALMLLVPALGAYAWYQGSETIGDLHVLVMNGMLALIGLHAAAGLFHHYVMKDGLLSRISPL